MERIMKQRWGRILSLLINSVAVRVLCFLLGTGLLLASLLGLYLALTTPREAARRVSIPVVNYQQQGNFHYTVHLKPSPLFQTTELGPGQVYFTRLVDNITMTFSYLFSSDQPLEEVEFNYQANAAFGSAGLWEKQFVLVPPTITALDHSSFSFSFALPIPQFIELLETFREETGTGMPSPQLSVKVQIQPQASTEYGPITEPFEQTLVFHFEDAMIRVEEELKKSQSATMTETKLAPVPGLAWIIIPSGIGILVSSFLLAYLSYSYTQLRSSIPTAEKELRHAEKKLQGLLVQTDKLPPVGEGQVLIRLNSLPDLVNLAEETFRPVVYSANEGRFVYCMTDGSGTVRYEYASEREEDANRRAN